MPRVWVTGAAGLIGSHIVAELQRCGRFIPIPVSRQTVDLEHYQALTAAFKRDDPELVIHCAAYSDTAFCELQPERAFAVNVEVTSRLAELAHDRRLIFFSSDLVFDGQEGNYDEAALVRPLSVYARTKVAAEQAVLTNRRHTVVRTSLTAGPSPGGNKGFDESLIAAWRAGRCVTLFVDEFRNPIAAAVTAKAVGEMLEKGLTGLYHLAGAERLSRYEIGCLLAAQHENLNPRLSPGTLTEYRGQPRPADCSLNCTKLQQELSFALPSFSRWLQERSKP